MQRSVELAEDVRADRKMNQWTFLIILLLIVVAGGAVLISVLVGKTKDEKNEADDRCLECIRENCPINSDDITNPERLCLALKATQDCECKGVCFSQCEKALSYNPEQCTVNNIC